MKLPLIHYIIVRRDVPLGVALAQTAHAAGESFYKFKVLQKYQPSGSSLSIKAPAMGLEYEGEKPSVPTTFDAHRTTVVVLGARNEERLAKLERYLRDAHVDFVAVREPDAPWNDALMAIGIVPGDRNELSPHFRDFDVLSELDVH